LKNFDDTIEHKYFKLTLSWIELFISMKF